MAWLFLRAPFDGSSRLFCGKLRTASLLHQKCLGKGFALMEPVRPRLDLVAYYDQLAADFASRYDTVTFEAVHPNLSKHLPSLGRVLDVGSGSGRDARGLAARGLHVTAVEPSAAFRRLGGRAVLMDNLDRRSVVLNAPKVVHASRSVWLPAVGTALKAPLLTVGRQEADLFAFGPGGIHVLESKGRSVRNGAGRLRPACSVW